jgi:hypothetical protein
MHNLAEPVYFRVEDAEKHGVTEAILLMNLAYWIRTNRSTDPDYQFHEMSPHNLATVLPYSESTLKRALKHLTDEDVGVLIARRPSDGRCASEYRFADKNLLQLLGPDQNAGGSDQDSQKPCLNMGGTYLDMSGPKANNAGPETNVSGPELDNNTILIDNHFEDTCLEDKKLITKKFESASVPETFSLSNGSNQDRVSTATLAAPFNPFEEPIVSVPKVDVDANPYALASLARVGTTDNQLSASNSAAPLPATPFVT